MVSHIPFFRTLSELQTGDNRWLSVLAGLSVLRLIDSYSSESKWAVETDQMMIASAKRLVAAIPQIDPARAILIRAVESLERSKYLSVELGRELQRYGRSLDLEGRWSLASDVFQTISELFANPPFTELSIEASIALGATARTNGDWTTSDRAYAKAQHLADAIGNHQLSLTVRVGMAASYRLRGNLPAAEAELEEVLAGARAADLHEVEALALHDMASVAHARGDYLRAVHNGYASLELTTDRTARERILGNIAAAYAGLGMMGAARDGYSIVALTSPHQLVRWQATLNLVELAVEDGDERLFDELLGQIENAALDPQLAAYRLYYTGLGLRRFGRNNSDQLLADAMAFASQHQMHQLAHEIAQSIDVGHVSAAGNVTPLVVEGEESEELQHIAEALSRLRENAANHTA